MTDWKALCAELLGALETEGYAHWPGGPDGDPLIEQTRAALAQPEPEAVGKNADVRRMCEIILGNTFGNEELDSLALHVGHHPDVLNASPVPAPPAEGEVAELVAWLREQADLELGCTFDADYFIEDAAVRNLTRAAALLEQRHPTPVPVSERLPGPEDCDAEGFCWWFSPADPF